MSGDAGAAAVVAAIAEAAAAQDLLGARAHRLQIGSLADRGRGVDAGEVNRLDVAGAYRIARRLQDARIAAGDVAVGRKVGFTNRNIWDQYGVHAPIWGTMYASTVHGPAPRHVLSLASFAEPRIEPEIVFRFGAAPPPGAGLCEILACVEWVAHGFEIVDSHWRGWKFAAVDTMADGGLHGALVIGPTMRPQSLASSLDALVARLAAFSITLACDGVERDRGTGANVLGNPLEAVRHLQAVLADRSDFVPLAPGEIVTTGTLTGAWLVARGETWSTVMAGIDLAGLDIRFT